MSPMSAAVEFFNNINLLKDDPDLAPRIDSCGRRLYFIHDGSINCVFASKDKPWTAMTEKEIADFIQMYVNAKPYKAR